MSLVVPSGFCSALIFLLNHHNTIYPYFFHSYQFVGFLCLLFTMFILVLLKSSSSHFIAIFGIVVYSDHTLASGMSFPFPSILFLEPLRPQS